MLALFYLIVHFYITVYSSLPYHFILLINLIWGSNRVQGSTSPLARSPEASKTGAGLVNFARSVVRGLVEIFWVINSYSDYIF